ncbi:PREDICTED: WD repeat-containing protein 87-like [Cercocebus atys]|uniref:WD repeat-containing protein 87-like n=1 Tax=Cercocebus atys TaxID=9531 RepID=UPI0005F3A57E|nr:PREDICTED: WD repeat-containing protein 87-like [Cercocebus atys]
MLMPSEDAGEQREARKSEQVETQHVTLQPELPLSSLSTVKSQDYAETENEVILQVMEAMEATEALEATDTMEAIDQGSMKDYGDVISKLERKEHIKRLWKKAMRKSHRIADVQWKEKQDLKDVSEVTTEEPKEDVIKIDEQEEGKWKKSEKKKTRGLAGTPGHASRPDTRSWRDDICSLVTSRIASSHPGMLRDLGKELVGLAGVILADRQPSWNLFQEICPLLKDSSSVSLELDDRVLEETPTITKQVIKGGVKDKRTGVLTEQEDKKALKEDEKFSQEEKKKKAVFPADRLVLEKRKFKRKMGKLAKQERKIAKEERKLTKPEEKMQRKKKPTKDKKKLTHPEEKMAQEEEIRASPQKELIMEDQKLVLEEKRLTGKRGQLLGKGKKVIRKKQPILKRERSEWEKMQAQEESMRAQEEKELAGEEEELAGEEKELAGEEKELAREEKELAEEEEKLLAEEDKELAEEEEVAGEEEELAEEEEELAGEEEELAEEEEELAGEEELAEEDKELAEEEEEKAIEEEEQWIQEKLALQKEKLAHEERVWSQKDKKRAWKKKKEVEPKKRVWKKEKLSLEEEEQAGEMEEEFQEKEKEAKEIEKRPLAKRQAPKDSKLAKKESDIAEKEKAMAREGIGITEKKKKITQEEKEIMKEEGKLSQEDRKLAYDIMTKERDVAKKKKKTKEERKQAMRKLDMEEGIGSEEKEARFREENIRMKENQLFGILARIVRELVTVPSEEREITEGETSSIIEKSEIDGDRWEFFKEQRELIKEEKEQAQKHRKLVDRLVTKERMLTDKESLEEDQKLLEEVQENILFNKIQVQTMLKEFQKTNLLEKRQVEELLKKVEERELKKTQMKWLLDNLRIILLKDLYKGLTEKETEEGLIKKGKQEEILPKKEKRKHLIKKKKASMSEEELEDNLTKKLKEEGLTQKRKMEKRLTKEKERLIKKKEGPQEEKKSLSEEEWGRWSEEEEEESLKEEEEEMEEKEKEEKERQKDVESLSEEKEKESRLMEAMFSEEERVLKTKFPKEEVRLSKLVIEGEDLAEESEGTAKGEMHFKKEGLLDVRRDSRLMDKAMWPTVLKSPSKIPFQVTLEEKEGTPLKVLEDHLDSENRQGRQLLGVHPMTSSLGREENELLEKARGMFLQAMETGLETQVPEGLHRPEFQLSDTSMEPHKPKHRHKGERWKWFLGYQDSLMGETKGQAPAPVPAFSPEMPDRRYRRLAFSEASFSDEDWINNALQRLEAGKQLSRDSFHRLSQILRDFTSKRHLKWMRMSNLKVIAKHLRQNLELSPTDTLQLCKEVLSPVHLKEIPPIRKKETQKWLGLSSVPKPVLPSAIKRTQTPQAVSWHLLAESHRKKQAQQLSTALKEIKHLYPVTRDVPIAVCPSVDKKSLALVFEKDFPALRRKGEISKSHPSAKEEALPIPAPVIPPITKRIQVPKAMNWHLLEEPHRSAQVQRLSDALKEMEMQHFYPATRDMFTGAHASVDKQTLALMFQKDLGAFKGKGRPPKLPKLEKKAQSISKKKEEMPLWETFVALYHVLRMLQQRYAKDSAAWMEQFYQLMDLYQLKSPRIQRLLLELLQREELQPQETIYKNALKTKELAYGERLFYHLFCGHSHDPAGPLKFQDVVPLPGQNNVHTIQPEGIAQYGFLQLAWKSLPQVSPHRIERLPSVPTPTMIGLNIRTLGFYGKMSLGHRF